MNAIEMKGLTKYYGKTLGAKNLNLNIPQGSFYGFIGPNGAGKSTTLRMLLNIIFPSRGQAKVLGKDIVKDAFDIKHFVGYLPSEINLYQDLKVSEMLAQAISFYQNSRWQDKAIMADWANCIYSLERGQRQKAMHDKVNHIVNTLQLDINKKIGDLSFGNTKKMGITLSMLHSPKILILDEPTGGLDPLMQDKYFELLNEEHKQGCTIFFSSHILNEVEKVCDMVAIIKNGEIIRAEGIEVLKQKSLKQVSLWISSSDINNLLNSFGLTETAEDVNITKAYDDISKLTFKNAGQVNILISKLSNFNVQNLTINEPTLEDIFKHYYM